MRTLFAIVFFCLCPALFLFAGEGDKVLVYYFENLSGEKGYDDLSYGIPLFLYARLSESADSSKVVVIDRGGLDLRGKESSVDLWKTSSLINIAGKRGFDQVLYGAFYVFAGKPVIAGKVLYAKSGLVLDVTEKESVYFGPIGEAESRTVEEIAGGGEEMVQKDYSPPFARTFGSPVVQKNKSVSVSAGTLVPLGQWADVYPPGLFSDFSFIFFPKMNTLPLGLGVNANYSFLRRGAGAFAESSIMSFSLGPTLQYKLVMKKVNKGLVFDAGAGMAMSLLYTNSESFPSFDPFVKGGLTFLITTRKKLSLSVKAGVFSINYRTVPIDSLYLQLGMWGG